MTPQDLTTTEAVLEWVSAQAQRWEMGNAHTNTATAAYLAECVRLAPVYRKVLKRLGCTFREDGTVLTSPYRDAEREVENERLRQAFDAAYVDVAHDAVRPRQTRSLGDVMRDLYDAMKGGDK